MIYAVEMKPGLRTPGNAVILRLHEIDQLMVSTTAQFGRQNLSECGASMLMMANADCL